jgi:hypothetical protein
MNPEQSPMIEKEVKHDCEFFLTTDVAVHSCECDWITVSDNSTVQVYVPLTQFESQSKRIEELTGENERLQKKIAEQADFIENGLDRNERFDNAEKQWLERHEKDQVEVSRLTGEVERLKHTIEGLVPKSEMSQTVDPNGYATSATKILHALNLVIGEDVNEFAMPVIIQIIKNNLADIEPIRIELRQKDSEVIRLREALNNSIAALTDAKREVLELVKKPKDHWEVEPTLFLIDDSIKTSHSALSNSSTTKE